MKCKYCRQTIPPDKPQCPYCGAENPEYDDYVRQKAEEQQQNAEASKEVSDYIHSLKKQQELRRERQRKKQEQAAAQEHDTINLVKAVAIYSIFTAIITTVGFDQSHDIDFMSMLLLFYVGNLVGNFFLFALINAFIRNKPAKYILYTVFALSFCMIFNSCNSQNKPSTSHTTTSYTTYKTTEPVISSNDNSVSSKSVNSKPTDGMTFAQLKEQKWGANMLYTKCRDFDKLRPECRYYEARWYNSDGELIGYGILCCQDENDDTAILAGFRDYTE